VHFADRRMARPTDGVRREVLTLVLLVVAVDAAFIALYYAAGLAHAGGGLKLAFTIVWTLATLAVVIRGLRRVSAARGR
jgi:hypothetical protein